MMTTTTKEEEDCPQQQQLLLPDEITTEILSRLPAKSVEQCKCVCKTWRALIADPAFIHLHHLKAPIEWITLCNKKEEGKAFNYQLHYGEYNDNNDDGGNPPPPPFKHNQPVNYLPSTARCHQPRKQTTICSCNGLIFSMSIFAANMFVCNPFTREYVNLPCPLRFADNQFRSDFRRSKGISLASGFGYNSYTNEYKIVIIHSRARLSSSSAGYVTIYTLGSGRWRDVGDISPELIKGTTNNRGVFLNGALHWLTKKKEIVSFDLADELFRIVPSPPLLQSDDDYVPQLGLLRGCLYVTRKRIQDPAASQSSSTVLVDIWVMENNNNNELQQSWTRKFSISWKLGDDDDDLSADGYRPLALSKSGKLILFHNGGGYNKPLVSYDPGTQTSFVDDSFPKGSDLYVIRYVKSFLSLHTLGETINAVSSLPTLGETNAGQEIEVDGEEEKKRKWQSSDFPCMFLRRKSKPT